MTTTHKCTTLPIEDIITICTREHLDKGSSKSEITHEYNIGKSVSVVIIFLYIVQKFFGAIRSKRLCKFIQNSVHVVHLEALPRISIEWCNDYEKVLQSNLPYLGRVGPMQGCL